MSMDFTPAVLRNKGVPVKVAMVRPLNEIAPDAGPWERLKGDDGHPLTDVLYVRFDGNQLVDLEDEFGTVDGIAEMLRERTFRTVRNVLATAWGMPPKKVGVMMLEGEWVNYSTAIGAGIALANGVDPQQAAEIVRVGCTANAELSVAQGEWLTAMVEEADSAAKAMKEAVAASRGPSGAKPGSDPGETPSASSS